MNRTFVLSVVLMVAAGQNAALFCGAWCPQEIASMVCQHQAPATSASVSVAEHCGTQAAAITVVTVESRRPVSAPSIVDALADGHATHAPADGDRAALQSRRSPFHGAHPLIARRI